MSEKVMQIRQLMNGMSQAELREVGGHLRDCFNANKTTAMLEVKATLGMNDKVQFVGKRGRLIQGRITKFNRTTVNVDAGDHGQWTVAASLLTKVAS